MGEAATATTTAPADVGDEPEPAATQAAISIRDVARSFPKKVALRAVTLEVERGEIHALLGPNGAGKSTLLRILCGLTDPTAGEARILGLPSSQLSQPNNRGLVGFAPSNDRSVYMRISGLENLVFFGRLHGLSRREARRRGLEGLRAVGLEDAAKVRAGLYSHGMQKRLGVARALLMASPVMLVDEATHDLDPRGARLVRDLVSDLAADGTAVLWATQRIDEIRAFADRVTVLDQGAVRFAGTVEQLTAVTGHRRTLLQLASDGLRGEALRGCAERAVAPYGSLHPAPGGDDGHCLLTLRDGSVLGQAVVALTEAGVRVVGCAQPESELEAAFLTLTDGAGQ